MRPKLIPFAILLAALFVGAAAGQNSQKEPGESIKRGNAKHSKAEYLAAIEEYQRVTPKAREIYSQALYNIGVCYYELWLTEDAIVMYRKAAAARAGRYPKALFALGVALEDLKRLDEAKDAYLQSFAASSGQEKTAAHFRLGLLLARENDYERAAKHFRKAISGETTPGSHNNLGVMLALSGRLHEAEKEFEVALRESSGAFADAAYNLELCRSLLKAPPKESLAWLKLVATTDTSGKDLRIE